MLDDGTIKIYSRNLEDSSMKFPDIVERIPLVILANKKKFYYDHSDCRDRKD